MQGQSEGGKGGDGACSAPEEDAAEGKGERFDHLAIQKSDVGTERQRRWAARLVIYGRFVLSKRG